VLEAAGVTAQAYATPFHRATSEILGDGNQPFLKNFLFGEPENRISTADVLRRKLQTTWLSGEDSFYTV
jgi:hypothetical protein